MARTPIAASKESDVTSANEETLQFDDDNLRGEAQHAISFILVMSTADTFRPVNVLTDLFIRM